MIETGDKFGDIASELRDSQTISEFVSGGPKNYLCRVLDTVTGTVEKTVCKVRGIYLNYNASGMVNFEVIRDMILRGNKGDELIVVNVHTEKKIKRNRKGEIISIVTEPEDKL